MSTHCHAWKSLPKAGVMLCTLSLGHRGNHLDVPHNRAFAVADGYPRHR